MTESEIRRERLRHLEWVRDHVRRGPVVRWSESLIDALTWAQRREIHVGVEYDLISDSTREGYELGKGPWGDPEFAEALRSADPVEAVTAFLDESWGRGTVQVVQETRERVVREAVAFALAHPDWRVVDDCGSWDGSVVDDESMAKAIENGDDPNDSDFPLYLRVGSRYKKGE